MADTTGPIFRDTPAVNDFIRKLGFDPKITRRVIVDIPAHGIVQVYVEAFGAAAAFDIPNLGLRFRDVSYHIIADGSVAPIHVTDDDGG